MSAIPGTSGQVLLLTGPAAAGKSTAAKRLAEESSTPSVHLAGDLFAHSLKQGRKRGWESGADHQNRVVVEATAEAACAYGAGGYFVVVDAMIRPQYMDVFIVPFVRRGVPLHYAVLRPPLQVIRERSATRPRQERHQDWTLVHIYAYFDDLRGRDAHLIDPSLDEDGIVAAIGHRMSDHSLVVT